MKYRLQKRPQLFLKSLYLRHFRLYEETEISFDPKINTIVGENAQGKTTLLEAIFLLSTGRSFRTEHLSELIQEGASFFYLEAEIIKHTISHVVKIFFDGTHKKLQIDSNTFGTFSPLLGAFPSILSTPADDDLVQGSPMVRRRFLNLHLAQSDPLYVHHLSRFLRSMKQRNYLLRNLASDAIDCFESEMALSASYLAAQRTQLIEEIQRHLIPEEETVEMRLHLGHLAHPEKYREQLKKARLREKQLGFTLHGPHRDDVAFFIAKKPARTFASEGQKKSAVTSLRLAEWERLSQKMGFLPIMALDDFSRALDPVRQKTLLTRLQAMGQVFLTTPLPYTEGLVQRIEKGKVACR